MALHQFDSIERFESANEDRRGRSGGLARNVEHEVRAIVEKDICMALREIHGANARCGAAEMVPGRIARRIGFGFDDAAAKASSGEIVDDNFADEEARERDGVLRKFRAA